MNKQPADVDLRNIPRRPFGVYVLVVILLLGVLTALLEILQLSMDLSGFLAWVSHVMRDFSGLVAISRFLTNDPDVVTIMNSIIIIIWLLVIAGMWTLQRWAWLTVMIAAGINLTFALYRYFAGDPDFISMIVNVAVVFYLNERSVQHAYARRKAEVPE